MKKDTNNKVIQDALRQLRGDNPRERLLHRLHGVALVLGGYSASEAARIYGDSPRAVAYWVRRFADEGVSGLEDESRPGRPSKISVSQQKRMQTFLRRAEVGGKRINANALSTFILTEFGIDVTPRQCWRILKRLRS